VKVGHFLRIARAHQPEESLRAFMEIRWLMRFAVQPNG
jgi:hypothetical protein